MLRVEGEKKVLVCLVCLFEQNHFAFRCFYYSPAPYAFQNTHPHFWPFAQGVSEYQHTGISRMLSYSGKKIRDAGVSELYHLTYFEPSAN